MGEFVRLTLRLGEAVAIRPPMVIRLTGMAKGGTAMFLIGEVRIEVRETVDEILAMLEEPTGWPKSRILTDENFNRKFSEEMKKAGIPVREKDPPKTLGEAADYLADLIEERPAFGTMAIEKFVEQFSSEERTVNASWGRAATPEMIKSAEAELKRSEKADDPWEDFKAKRPWVLDPENSDMVGTLEKLVRRGFKVEFERGRWTIMAPPKGSTKIGGKDE